jgi:hypothetical protein
MPRFDRVLSGLAGSAASITKAGEMAHVSGPLSTRREWSVVRLEALYELAYLRIFAAWEMCLEAVFYRALCGYSSAAGQEALVGGVPYYRNLAAAEIAAAGGKSYLLWHNPQIVIDRCKKFFQPGPGHQCAQEIMLTSNFSQIAALASIRHRIVHDQRDAKQKFDKVTLALAARTYQGSRPGKFLRDWDKSGPPARRWLEVTSQELIGMIGQIV